MLRMEVRKQNHINDKQNITWIKPELIKNGLDSIVSFFSVAYGIMFVLSMCYNIGYFRYINPQIVDLMTFGDYVNDTIHNIWALLIGAIVFFGTSLALVKNQTNVEFNKVIAYGIFALLATIYFFLQKITYSKFWPTIKTLILKSEMLPLLIIFICLVVIAITLTIYKISAKIFFQNISRYAIGSLPILLFLLFVLTPYIGGMIEGYIENTYIDDIDYKGHRIDLTVLYGPQKVILKEAFIVKKIEKGLVIRYLDPNNVGKKSYVSFINWGNIVDINYPNLYKIETDQDKKDDKDKNIG
jgi:hypothetical protein